MIVVTGATGTVGSGVVDLLIERGEQVRAVSRKPGGTAPAGLEWLTADLTEPSSLAGMATGADAIFLLSTGENGPEQDRNVLAEAERASVRMIVKLSALSVAHGADDPISSRHRAGEHALQAGSVPWCFLRPGGFMSNTLGWVDSIKHTGTVYAPFGYGRTAVIDPQDIAESAVKCLLQDAYAGRAYELTGPQALSVDDQVQIIGRVIGRELKYVEVGPDDAKQSMVGAGMPVGAADAVIGTLAAANSDFASRITDGVTAITGRPPTFFHDWVSANQAAFS